VVSESIYEALAEFNQDGSVFGHGFTNSGHPVGCAVALEALSIYEEMDVVAHVRRAGDLLKSGFIETSKNSPIVGEIRGEGLMLAVELVEDQATRRPFEPQRKVGQEFDRLCLAHGMITRVMGDIVGFCPPLIVGSAEIDEIVSVFAGALRGVETWVARAASA
jgi:4-aminobutyrate---pyruvate transaminase